MNRRCSLVRPTVVRYDLVLASLIGDTAWLGYLTAAAAR
jgi:hypothetical protein